MDKATMTGLLVTMVMLFIGTVHGMRYRYHHSKPSSYRSLCSKIERLERKVSLLNQPVHIHVNGNNDQASLSADGTHVHVHVSMDDKKEVSSDDYAYASCHLQPNSAGSSGTNVHGYVHLRQKPYSKIEIKVDLTGFPKRGLYGFHVHQLADFQNGCNSFGGHYNPYGKNHGGPKDEERHVGDWGNLNVVASGDIKVVMTDRLASLFGPESIVGRGIVVHAGTDDLGRGGDAGSLATGNAGARLACCAIGWSKEGW